MTLNQGKYRFFNPNEIQPEGWLKKQLEIQAKGLSGNLDLFWPDIADSSWIGGSHEGWERVPYWLDGFIPLAWLLDDDGMKERATKYINYIIDHQEEDGWISPAKGQERDRYDMWAAFLIVKVLVLYHDFTDDERIEEVVRKTLISMDRHIDKFMLFDWAQARWFEVLIGIWWLYERSPEDWLLKLATKVSAQGLDWKKLFENWPYRVTQKNWSQMNHVVNNAMMLKSGALMWKMTGQEDLLKEAEMMYGELMKYHGMVTGVFTGDECLAGLSPTQGTELCAVAELMYSFSHLLSITGNPVWGDRLEKVAFNALPATFSPDMWTHQYDQQVNQVQCSRQEHPVFYTNSGESNLFGLEPNFGCCTANLSQPWPKLALSTFMRTENGILSSIFCPSRVKTSLHGVGVQVSLETDYPFSDVLNYQVQVDSRIDFDLSIRIPAWSTQVDVSGDHMNYNMEEGLLNIVGPFEGLSNINIQLHRIPEMVARPNEMYALVHGPLVYALPIKSQWKQINKDMEGHEFPHCDYEIFPTSDWNYKLLIDPKHIEAGVRFEYKKLGQMPFSEEGAPLVAKVRAKKIDWPIRDGVAARVPLERWSECKEEEVELIPYGCTTLRLTEMPIDEGY